MYNVLSGAITGAPNSTKTRKKGTAARGKDPLKPDQSEWELQRVTIEEKETTIVENGIL
ncbi:hypothetical protein KTH_05560 [Thermosporothrix hazakensis]|jgi:hypothetical protein|uniref:Uncharacterized protein n=1 Tax=Thermosporothrix sp. COM3 TaxID=2490863 RepID=A0A455SDP7_9CHLR|nr:hypothetical protein KTC_06370 [Thermosporothrix sp. COM3]GCE45687.1 hypothetical protein KTH_05560 [Thermosporothrix hazakensis]